MTTPTPPAMQRITPDNPPQFPCWIYSKVLGEYNWWKCPNRGSFNYYGDGLYWHPDASTAPTQRPDEWPGKATTEKLEAHLGIAPTPAQSATPRTDAIVFGKLGYIETANDMKVMLTLARTLETELAASKAECEWKVTEYLAAPHCCNGADCGCMGTSRLELLVWEEYGKQRDQLRAENASLTTELSGLVHENENLRGLLDYIGGVLERGEDQIDLPDLINAALSEKSETLVEKSTKNTENPT